MGFYRPLLQSAFQ